MTALPLVIVGAGSIGQRHMASGNGQSQRPCGCCGARCGLGGEPGPVVASGEDYLRIIGTQGALAFSSCTRWAGGVRPQDWTAPLVPHRPDAGARVDPLDARLTRFARVASGAQDDVLCMGSDGLRALEVTLASACAARRGETVSPRDVSPTFNGF